MLPSPPSPPTPHKCEPLRRVTHHPPHSHATQVAEKEMCDTKTAEEELLNRLNVSSFFPGQRECIGSVVGLPDCPWGTEQGKDTWAGFPCGGGKTLVMDASVLLLGGVTILVEPTTALILQMATHFQSMFNANPTLRAQVFALTPFPTLHHSSPAPRYWVSPHASKVSSVWFGRVYWRAVLVVVLVLVLVVVGHSSKASTG